MREIQNQSNGLQNTAKGLIIDEIQKLLIQFGIEESYIPGWLEYYSDMVELDGYTPQVATQILIQNLENPERNWQ